MEDLLHVRTYGTHASFLCLFCSVCCPYPLLAIPGLLSFIALVFVWVAAINCNFYSISFVTTEGRDATLRVGLWTVQYYYVDYSNEYYWGSFCSGWKNANFFSYHNLDGALKAARAFGMMSAVLGTISFVLILIPMCVSFGDDLRYLLVLCGMCIFTGIAALLDLVRTGNVKLAFFFTWYECLTTYNPPGCLVVGYLHKCIEL